MHTTHGEVGSRGRSFGLLALGFRAGVLSAMLATGAFAAEPSERDRAGCLPPEIAPFFEPPPEWAGKLGDYRPVLVFDDGRPVRTADEWRARRREIRDYWFNVIGRWPPLLEEPKIEVAGVESRDGLEQRTVRVQAAEDLWLDGYLLIPAPPRADSPIARRGAVLVVYYDAQTGAGLKPDGGLRDFGDQLARRGFVTLSIGWPRSYTDRENVRRQTLSTLAYLAANCRTALARQPEVDSRRIGIVGHSFGGKWALFAACLDERFAAGAWSDPGVAFDERRPNVNYWEPWYLGYEEGTARKPGVPTEANPRTGPYKKLVSECRDLHELQALMAPRPFLVSGGAEDPIERWQALNHAVAVNELLGLRHRVGLTLRPSHSPTEQSNAQLYRFFEHFLGPAADDPGKQSEGVRD